MLIKTFELKIFRAKVQKNTNKPTKKKINTNPYRRRKKKQKQDNHNRFAIFVAKH